MLSKEEREYVRCAAPDQSIRRDVARDMLDELEAAEAREAELREQVEHDADYQTLLAEFLAVKDERDALREQLEGCRARLRFHLGEDRAALEGGKDVRS